MLEFGARFLNDFYVKVALDPISREGVVAVETINIEGEQVVTTGTITWDDGE